MHIEKIFEKHKTTFSFEFFPPKTDKGSERLFENIKRLLPLDPAFVSVTYGAGGSSRKLTRDLVLRLQTETELTVIPHLTCVGASRDEIGEIIQDYKSNGIQNIMALRGDPPISLEEAVTHVNDGFKYATELVAFIKKEFPSMGIGVAGFPEGHPLARNRLVEMDHLKEKVDAGADYICTQLFFDNRDLYDFKERCVLAGIDVPVIAGIMPVQTLSGMKRMADLSPGTRFPAGLLRGIGSAANDDGVAHFGIGWATSQVRELIQHDVKGVHFYTLNNSAATLEIYHSLGMTTSNEKIESVGR